MENTITINHKLVKSACICLDKQNDNKRQIKINLDSTVVKNNNELYTPLSMSTIDDKEYENFVVPNFEYAVKYPDADDFDITYFNYSKRPADAINYVKNGVADALISCKLFNSVFIRRQELHPVIFLDRNKGKEMRDKTLEGWPDDIKYKWALCRRTKHSFVGVREFLRKDYQDLELDEPLEKPFCFFEPEASCDNIGRIEAYKSGFGNLPATEIYMADTEEEILDLIPKVQKEIIETLGKLPDINDGSEVNEVNNYAWYPFQYILFEG